MPRSGTTTHTTATGNGTSWLDAPVAFHYPATRRLAAWWSDTRRSEDLPRKDALEPLAVPDLLPFVWINEHEPVSGHFVYRLVGEEIRARYDTPLKDRALAEIFPAEAIARIHRTMKQVLTVPCAFHHVGAIYECYNRIGFGERLLLPLSDGNGTATHILGISFYEVGSCAPAMKLDADGGDGDHDVCRFYPVSAVETLAFPDGRQAAPRDPMAD